MMDDRVRSYWTPAVDIWKHHGLMGLMGLMKPSGDHCGGTSYDTVETGHRAPYIA